jgi:type VI secretion system protein ImpF
MPEKPAAAVGRSSQLLPALLDRLTDLAPHERGEPVHARSMSKSEFRRSVLRDLGWLLNTTSAESEIAFDGVPNVRESVLNFGVQALSGKYLVEDDLRALEAAVANSIRRFEPRILADTLRVKVVTSDSEQATRNHLSMEIRGQLWAEPYPIELLLRSRVDLECGQIALVDALAG